MKWKRRLALMGILALAMGYAYRTFATSERAPRPVVPAEHLRTAIFAGGCFWCMEPPFEKLPGVVDAVSGYTGGRTQNPSYQEVCRGNTGHMEAIQVSYDHRIISYEDLLQVFWRSMDPTDEGGQFADRGQSYESAIFVQNDEQRSAALKSQRELDESGRFDKPVVTPIRDAEVFYPAESYHQDYYLTNPVRYKMYRSGSGRDAFLENAWGDELEYKPQTPVDGIYVSESGETEVVYFRPSDEDIRDRLTTLQYRVTQEDGTERAFANEYWDNKRAGIYVDIVSGEPLFSSTDKYVSGTGWPSFTRPIEDAFVVTKTDYKLILPRSEVRSRISDSHLGHVFDDGPNPTGLRYCINSAALRFVAEEDLVVSGYGKYKSLFTIGI